MSLYSWIEYRLPIFSFIDKTVGSKYPAPRNLNALYQLGVLAGVVLMIQIITGLALAMHYVPNTEMAFESVEKIMRDVNYGWLIRYMHANGASMFFIAVYIHIFRGLYYGSYKKPREMVWIIGVAILIIMMATAFMGYVLPWGQMSFWGATVITNLFSVVPFFGETIVQWLWGGFTVGNPTLNRFFALHFLLPFILLGAVLMHIWALHVRKSNNPLGIDPKGEKDQVPFHPYYTTKDLLGIVIFGIFFSVFLFFLPNLLGHPDNYIPANPLVTPEHIVPEWYFLPFYAMLRAVPDKLFGVIAMFSAIGVLFILPWLDTSKVRSARFRPIYKKFFWIFVLNCLVLTYLGGQPAEGIYVTFSRISTGYYFLHFLVIMPLLGKLEKPLPLPNSIYEAILKDRKK